jgi:CheY-like chemotaxis protein
MLEEQDFELVLLDIQLPGLDGYSLLKIIKEKYPDTAVIAVTAYAMSGDREKILRAGADDYVSKPVNIEELVDKIGKNLGDI